jgi:tetratricopeptide (TPR) repeat protein
MSLSFVILYFRIYDMSALIEGFSYDIFISYRQKDNRYDGWVTEFVDNLKRELEATFKEEVSLYVDINPHDGLLETHDVDASLREKLKCLVFIPVISRTYCDPKSFAWENEFRAFIDQASGDQFGLRVTLPDGNVSLRVLPVRIHDLDIADIRLCESTLGSVLRGVEFIYKSPGVNRPLRSAEDNPHANLNHTIYRDQINKVALAIKDIITGMLSTPGQAATSEKEKVDHKADKGIAGASVITRSRKLVKRILLFIPALLLLVAAVYIFSGSTTIPFDKRDWILITDFENTTGDEVFDKSLYTAFSITTDQSRYINVFPRQRMMETLTMMKKNPDTFIDEKAGREIASRENISVYIVPGISQVGDRYVIDAKIHETENGNLLRSEVLFADNRNDILPCLDRLSHRIRRGLGESRYMISTQDKPLSRVTTSSLEALKLFSLGIDAHFKLEFDKARDYYESALNIDTGFTAARASLGNILVERFDAEKGKELLRQSIRSVDNLTDKEKYGILAFYAVNVEKDISKGIEYTRRLTDLYPDDPAYHNNLGYYYQLAARYEEAAGEYKEAIRLNPHQALTYSGLLWIYLEKLGQPDSALVWARKMVADNPQNAWGYWNLGSAWFCNDSLARAVQAFRKACELNPKLTVSLFRLAHTYSIMGSYDESINILEKIPEINPEETASAWYNIGVQYQLKGNEKEAKKYFEKYREYATAYWLRDWSDSPYTYICLSAVEARMGDMDKSHQMLQKAMGMDSTLHARFAGVLCLQGELPEALNQIKKSLDRGYRDLAWIKMDPDLRALQYDIRFRSMLEKYFPGQ